MWNALKSAITNLCKCILVVDKISLKLNIKYIINVVLCVLICVVVCS